MESIQLREAENRLTETEDGSLEEKLSHTTQKAQEIAQKQFNSPLNQQLAQSIIVEALNEFDQSLTPYKRGYIWENILSEVSMEAPAGSAETAEEKALKNELFLRTIHICATTSLKQSRALLDQIKAGFRVDDVEQQKKHFTAYYIQRSLLEELNLFLEADTIEQVQAIISQDIEQNCTIDNVPEALELLFTLLENPEATLNNFFEKPRPFKDFRFVFNQFNLNHRLSLLNMFLLQEADRTVQTHSRSRAIQRRNTLEDLFTQRITQILPEAFDLKLIGDAAEQIATYTLQCLQNKKSPNMQHAYKKELFTFNTCQ